MVEEEDATGRVLTPGLPAEKQAKVEKLIPLRFGKRFSNIVNGILTDDEPPEVIHNYDATFVEHYLQIKVDREIDRSLLCESGVRPDATKCGGFTPDFLNCKEDDARDGLYNKTSEGPYGENC